MALTTGVDRIVSLETCRHDTVRNIRDIVAASGDITTVLYGLRAMSRLGVPIETLDQLAKDYNRRIREQPEYDSAPPISEYVVQSGNSFQRRVLTGDTPVSIPVPDE